MAHTSIFRRKRTTELGEIYNATYVCFSVVSDSRTNSRILRWFGPQSHRGGFMQVGRKRGPTRGEGGTDQKMSDSSATFLACERVVTFKSSLGAARHFLAYMSLLPNSESRMSYQIIAAKLGTVVTLKSIPVFAH